MRNLTRPVVLAFFLLAAAFGCTPGGSATAEDAKKFIDSVNETMLRLGTESAQAEWVSENFITDDTQAITARAKKVVIDAGVRFAKEAVKFDKVEVPPDIRRQLNRLKLGLTMATPSDSKEGEELTKLAASFDAIYGKGKWC